MHWMDLFHHHSVIENVYFVLINHWFTSSVGLQFVGHKPVASLLVSTEYKLNYCIIVSS